VATPGIPRLAGDGLVRRSGAGHRAESAASTSRSRVMADG
jgi:hypothetical protein